MSPEESMHVRVEEERARRIAIQATVSRRVDDRMRRMDPACRDYSHSDHVRTLVKILGEVGAVDPSEWGMTVEGLQDALVDLAAEVQAWLESNLRDAAQ